jgi:hypothetical protein
MTRGDLKEAMTGWSDPAAWRHGPGDWQRLNALIDREVDAFMEATLCRFESRIDLTLAVMDSVIDLTDTSKVAVPVVLPVGVAIEAQWLTDLDGRPGPVTRGDATAGLALYRSLEEGRPVAWMVEGPRSIRLLPVCDDSYADSWIAGYAGHAPIGVGATYQESADADKLDDIAVPSTDEDLCAAWCAMRATRAAADMAAYSQLAAYVLQATAEARAKNLRDARPMQTRGRFQEVG